MRRLFTLSFVLTCAAVLWLGASHLTSQAAPSARDVALPMTDYMMIDLVPGVDLWQWYATESGFAPSNDFFGAYTAVAVNNTLYVGLGGAQPAVRSGALLAKYTNGTLTPISPLSERGVQEMIWVNGTLHIAGVDPCCGDDPETSNHYTYTPAGGLVKHRDPLNGLVNVLHSWALWYSPEDDLVYAAVSSFLSRPDARAGQIFTTTASTVDWNYVTDLGGYRAYDIRGSNGKLYAIANDIVKQPSRLTVSTDKGKTWSNVIVNNVANVYLEEFNGRLIALAGNRRALHAVDTANGNTVETYPLPTGVEISDSVTFNVLLAHNGYLYVSWQELYEGNTIYAIARSADLQNWERVVASADPITTLNSWPSRNWLILGTAGRNGSLWKVDLQDLFTERTYLPFVARP